MRNRHPRVLLFVVLLTAGGWWGQVIDALAHINERASTHTSGPHFENPAAQSHSDRCVLARPSFPTQNTEWYGSILALRSPTRSRDLPCSAEFAGYPVTGVPRTRSPPVS